ncbi:MAG: transporter substrate-binding domain-containing protein [Verrucomicrobiales bacterium]|nr:transporter substrate-binding domain-containing protein [Verrucomicrobiales bacterium]
MNKSARSLHAIKFCLCLSAALWLRGLGLGTAAAAEPSPSLLPDLLTPEERRWLEAHPTIRVAPTPDYHPLEYFDSIGKHWGITSDYFSLIEQRLSYRFKFVHLSPKQWLHLDPESRGADVVTASAETPARAVYWKLTPTYLTLPTYLITRRSVVDNITLAQLEGGRIAVVKGWAAEDYLRTRHPQLAVDAVPDVATGLKHVSFGLVDAFLSELPVATSWLEKEGITNLKLSGLGGYTYHLGISVRNDWPELHGILSKALASITPAEREMLYKRWVKIAMPDKFLSERARRILVWTGTSLAVLLLGSLSWNRALSSRVRVRTAQLQSELTARAQAEQSVRESEARYKHLFLQLLRAEDEERRRIARDLHDTTAQHLAAIHMNLTRLRTQPSGAAGEQVLTDSLALVGESVNEVRTLSYLLHPPLIEELGLAGALADYTTGFTKRSGVQVRLDLDHYTGRLSREVELVLFRVVQESLANVHRHSGSQTALVRLERDADQVRLEIQDNGCGIPPGATQGVGLRGMQERLRQIGGDLDIESDSEGTTVLASVRSPQPSEQSNTA